jgi:shikimate dehydrogenase
MRDRPAKRARVGPAIALIGDPVHESLSPAMHRAALAAIGSELDYVAFRVPRPSLRRVFPSFASTCAGLNVTTPLKEAVVPLLDAVSPAARWTGSVNTVTFDDGRSRGDSTDGAGFMAALKAATSAPVRQGVVVGTGGAARAVVAGLLEEGNEVTVTGRNVEAGARLVDELRDRWPGRRTGAGLPRLRFVASDRGTLAEVIRRADVLVNATPLGGRTGADAFPLPDPGLLHPGLTVADLVYRPAHTALLREAASRGCRVVPGIEMLIEQGARSFELWTGRPCPVDVMRHAAYDALESAEPTELRTQSAAAGGP